MAEKTIRLEPQKSHHFWWYVIGVLLIPILIGIYILYKKVSELIIKFRIDQSPQFHYTETIDIDSRGRYPSALER